MFVKSVGVINMRQSIENLVKNRIIDHGHGWGFTPMHFSDLGSDLSIRKALSVLQKQNFIRRLAQGIYDYPITHDLIIEKDYWVVWVLERLFSLEKLKHYFTFKGGTSLSKIYGLIDRFSEDIDLSIEREFFG